MTKSRSCDAIGCKVAVASGRFLCIKHWRMVPTATQRTINARYRACRADFGFLFDVAYLQACVDAIDGIALVEHFVGTGSAHHQLLRTAQRKAAS